jgi:opacity protein-like surface antigen
MVFILSNLVNNENLIKMKTRYLLAGLGVALLSISAQTMELKPYVSDKLAYARIHAGDNENRYSADVPPGKNNSDDDESMGSRIAIGLSAPFGVGIVRTEFEIGLNTKTKMKIVSEKHAEEVMYVRSRNTTYMFNTYYDFETGTEFTPYLGFGLGIANVKSKHKYESVITEGQYMRGKVKVNNFACSLGFGVNYAFDETLSIDLGYRYTHFGSVEGPIRFKEFNSGSVFDLDYAIVHSKVSSQDILFGLRYSL